MKLTDYIVVSILLWATLGLIIGCAPAGSAYQDNYNCIVYTKSKQKCKAHRCETYPSPSPEPSATPEPEASPEPAAEPIERCEVYDV